MRQKKNRNDFIELCTEILYVYMKQYNSNKIRHRSKKETILIKWHGIIAIVVISRGLWISGIFLHDPDKCITNAMIKIQLRMKSIRWTCHVLWGDVLVIPPWSLFALNNNNNNNNNNICGTFIISSYFVNFLCLFYYYCFLFKLCLLSCNHHSKIFDWIKVYVKAF